MSATESERAPFKAALDAAVQKRQELDVLIAQLASFAGVPVPEGVAASAADSGAQLAAPDTDPSALVADGEFYGKSATKATRALLSKLGRTRPLKTTEIFEAITKGGVRIQDTDVLYKSLARSKDFLRVAKGTWGLAEWYPERVVRNARSKESLDEDDGADDQTLPALDDVPIE